ncbi:MAG TPA: hypothetical protein DGL25_04510 [Dehalococcoidia bacterium]|nr:hypothetical protein [Dehalococcoidia bacterium]
MEHAGDWREAYKERLRSVEEAMALIGDGDLVTMGVLTPGALGSALADRAEQLGRLDIRTLAPTEPRLFTSDANGEREIELFLGEPLRSAHDAKIATYLPNTFMLGMKAHDAGREEARLPDVQITSCSEPNEAGYVQFGVHMWTRKAYTKRCPTTIGMIDPNITPGHGDIWVHVSEFAAFIDDVIEPVNIEAVEERVRTLAPEEHRAELLELISLASSDQIAIAEGMFHMLPPKIVRQAFGLTEVDAEAQRIADNLAPLIRDGDTIQVGVGTPSQLMFKAGAFDHAKHLGVHTELGSPGLAQLWERGNIDNSRKTLHRDRCVAVAWTGCDGIDLGIIRNNPAFEVYDPNYLLNPALMSQNSQMTSINSAVAVDLLGQISSEDRYGGQMINGTGGQPDTHISAALCPDGRAITVLRSTALEGSLTKIVAKHEAGTLVTIPRYLADTIVTEYGVARLLDKNHRQRAAELISIAHPDFRAELRKEATKHWG